MALASVEAGVQDLPDCSNCKGLERGLSQLDTLSCPAVEPVCLRPFWSPANERLLGIVRGRRNLGDQFAVCRGRGTRQGQLTGVALPNTANYQSGRAVQVILIMMGFYLVMSLLISLFANIYNSRMRLKER